MSHLVSTQITGFTWLGFILVIAILNSFYLRSKQKTKDREQEVRDFERMLRENRKERLSENRLELKDLEREYNEVRKSNERLENTLNQLISKMHEPSESTDDEESTE